MYEILPHKPLQEKLPTMYDLRTKDPEESGLPDVFHPVQAQLLSERLRALGFDPDLV